MIYIQTSKLRSTIFPYILNGTDKSSAPYPNIKDFEHQSIFGKPNFLMPMSEMDITAETLEVENVSIVSDAKYWILISCIPSCWTLIDSAIKLNFVTLLTSSLLIFFFGWMSIFLKRTDKKRSCVRISHRVTCSIVGSTEPRGTDYNKNPKDKYNENAKEFMKTGKISGWTFLSMNTGRLLWISNNDLNKITLELND